MEGDTIFKVNLPAEDGPSGTTAAGGSAILLRRLKEVSWFGHAEICRRE